MSKKNFQIPLSEAKLWTKIWQIACPTNCKAFLIPVEDLMGVLTEMGVLNQQDDNSYTYDPGSGRDVRAYLGVEPWNTKGKPEEKILLVGTERVPNPAGTPKYIYRDIIDGHPLLGDDENTGVYDFTDPCPNTCDCESPLNGEC